MPRLKYAHMSDAEFQRHLESEYARLQARLAKLDRVRAGASTLRRVKVRAHAVRAYTVGAHYRTIVSERKPR